MGKQHYQMGLLLLALASITANADVLGDLDDHYLGIQVSIPLAAGKPGLALQKARFSTLLISQRDGLREGLAFTQQPDGVQTLHYLRPTNEFELGRSEIEDHSISLRLNSEEFSVSQNDAVQALFVITVGVLVFYKLADIVAEDIADCLSNDDDCGDDEDEEKDGEAHRTYNRVSHSGFY